MSQTEHTNKFGRTAKKQEEIERSESIGKITIDQLKNMETDDDGLPILNSLKMLPILMSDPQK